MFQGLSTTGIGSLPHTDPEEACRVVFESVDIPFWPQLPHRSFLELMIPQYSEGFPFVRIEEKNLLVEKNSDDAVSAFYESIDKRMGFPISENYALGLHTFIGFLKKGRKFRALKGQVTGPLTFTLGLADNQKRPIYFDEEMRELALWLLKGKARWQIETLRPFADEIIIFIDEPILSALGTAAYIGVDSIEASRLLNEMVSTIKSYGAIAGIHCCSKAYWPMIFSSGLDIFSFDAYFFWDSLPIYHDEVKAFINRGGIIAWGIVPTTEAIRKVTINGLQEQFGKGLDSIEAIGIARERLINQSLITPSCGTGSMEIKDAMRVFSLLKGLKKSYARD
ncbi:MAG TPA: hypothetical protein DEP99_02610 [Nitrospiraceae bacterium]|nr:hypothetical protein [Nitrospiraceae bacterium]